jgi:hypothetical protein
MFPAVPPLRTYGAEATNLSPRDVRFRTAPRAMLVAALASASVFGAGCSSQADDAAASEDAVSIGTKDRAKIPLTEVSALALRKTGSKTELLALGDRTPTIAVGEMADDLDDIDVRTVDVKPALRAAGVETASDVQWEGIAADGTGRVLVLEENPGRVFIFKSDLSKVDHVMEIKVDRAGAGAELAEAWTRDANSRGEGLVLLQKGHILLAKEKEPRRILELGPEGDAPIGLKPLGARSKFEEPSGTKSKLVVLKSWKLADGTKRDFPDLSEIAVGPDGKLYVLSDEGRAFGQLGDLRGEEVDVVAKWTLNREIDKPEGLVFFGDRPLVASDIPGNGKNVFRLQRLQ